MDKKEFYELMQEIKQEIREEIQQTVNGKIDCLSKSFDEHKKEMQPIFDFYKATNVTSKIILKTSQVIMALGVIIGSILGFIKYVK